jgi:hypothetical protein
VQGLPDERLVHASLLYHLVRRPACARHRCTRRVGSDRHVRQACKLGVGADRTLFAGLARHVGCSPQRIRSGRRSNERTNRRGADWLRIYGVPHDLQPILTGNKMCAGSSHTAVSTTTTTTRLSSATQPQSDNTDNDDRDDNGSGYPSSGKRKRKNKTGFCVTIHFCIVVLFSPYKGVELDLNEHRNPLQI